MGYPKPTSSCPGPIRRRTTLSRLPSPSSTSPRSPAPTVTGTPTPKWSPTAAKKAQRILEAWQARRLKLDHLLSLLNSVCLLQHERAAASIRLRGQRAALAPHASHCFGSRLALAYGDT